MYIKLGTTTPDDDLSYILAKNPASPPYERRVGGASTGRRVVGRHTNDGQYEVVVHNDGMLFFNEMRAIGAFLGLEFAAFEGGQIDKTL